MRNSRSINKSGFTLIELMVVVAIIGILAAIAIPNFITYTTKAKQAEVKTLLKALHTSELSYFSENGFFTDDVNALEWEPKTSCTYRYSVGTTYIGSQNTGGNPMNNATAGAGHDNFTAVGWANIDDDSAVDTWQVTQIYSLTNVYDDVTEENVP